MMLAVILLKQFSVGIFKFRTSDIGNTSCSVILKSHRGVVSGDILEHTSLFV